MIPELIRLLTAEGLDFEEAVAEVEKTTAYTNHTILAEALETWPIAYLEEIVPQLVPIIRKLDEIAKTRSQDEATFVIDNDGRVHMASMDIHFSQSTNGVAAIHTDILKTRSCTASTNCIRINSTTKPTESRSGAGCSKPIRS